MLFAWEGMVNLSALLSCRFDFFKKKSNIFMFVYQGKLIFDSFYHHN